MLELDCLHNNTSFLLSLSPYEITYYLSTLSKRVSPLITLSFNHPKPTKGLDALSKSISTVFLEILRSFEVFLWFKNLVKYLPNVLTKKYKTIFRTISSLDKEVI